ncbi:hypothetical protein [Clostridium butyricum]|uniref:hypothetical protein n=1 Tax=Clostridium butyricum TaxID=1492 RepID=UPI00374FC806
MQLNLLEPIKATEIGVKADTHICKVYGASHIDDVKQMILKDVKDILQIESEVDQ